MTLRNHWKKPCSKLRARPLNETLETRLLFNVGLLDTSFNVIGYSLGPTAAVGSAPFFATGEGVVALPNGQSVVAGQVSIGPVNGIYVRRYDIDGSVDATFAKGEGYGGADGYAYIGAAIYQGYTNYVAPVVSRVAVDASGDILVAESGLGVFRLTAAGVPDHAFASDGFASVPGLMDMSVQSNSEIVVDTAASKVERLTAGGQVDETFGNGGETTVPIVPGQAGSEYTVADPPAQFPIFIQPHGSILIGGTTSSSDMGDMGDMGIVQLLSSGGINTAFGTNGIAIHDFGDSQDEDGSVDHDPSFVGAINITADGNIIAGGGDIYEKNINSTEDLAAVEFTPVGKSITTFGTGGRYENFTSGNSDSTFLGAYVAAVLTLENGDILLAGSSFDLEYPGPGNEGSILIVALTSTGQPDAGFGNPSDNAYGNPEVLAQIPDVTSGDGPLDFIYAAAETADGKVLLTGDASPTYQGPGFILARYIVQEITLPVLSISDATIAQGQDAQFQLALSGASKSPVMVSYTLQADSAPASDFDTMAGTLAVPAGATTATISIPTYGDSTESNEKFTLVLGSLSIGATFANSLPTESATGTITAVIVPQPSVITLSAAATTLVVGQDNQLTVSVASASAGGSLPTGNVVILQDGVALGTYPLQADAGFSQTYLVTSAAAASTFSAIYEGDDHYLSSTSNAVIQTYLTASSATGSIQSSGIVSTAVAGQKFKTRVPIQVSSTVDMRGRFTIALYLDHPGTGLDGQKILLKTQAINLGLIPGKAKAATVNLQAIPGGIAAGSYYLVLQLTDPEGGSSIVTSANTISIALPVVAISASAGAVVPAEPRAGKTSSVMLTISDIGNVSATGTLEISITEAGSTIVLASEKFKTAIPIQSPRRYKVKISIPKNSATSTLDPIAAITLEDSSIAIALPSISLDTKTAG